jgi:hypothetical protein
MFQAQIAFGLPAPPLVVSYGMGVNSTALLIELKRRGVRPDLIMFADTGSEKQGTYAYKPVIDTWLERARFPAIEVVRYEPKNFKNYPPYHSLEENLLTNATLPSLAFGFKSCSLKWKVAPQDAFIRNWRPALDCWSAGGRVRKAIGYDAGPADIRRRNHAGNLEDPDYEYWYPLIDWGLDREACKAIIVQEGLPVPPKSACYFCPATKPVEIEETPLAELRRIVVIEARARPRLTTIDGLWRKPVAGTRGGLAHPGSMTEFIRDRGLLPEEEIEQLIALTPTRLLSRGDIESWQAWLGTLFAEAAETCCKCGG